PNPPSDGGPADDPEQRHALRPSRRRAPPAVHRQPCIRCDPVCFDLQHRQRPAQRRRHSYHIRTGELIARTWRVPHTDPFSYHTPPLQWTAHEWLAELLMALIARAFGLTGLVVFFALLLALAHWLLYRSLRSLSDDLLLCTIVILLACATSATHWLARPHAFSLLLTVVWCDRLNRFQPGDR